MARIQQGEFEKALSQSLPESFYLPKELWQLIQWLEDRNQTFRFRKSKNIFLPTMPVQSIDHLWSSLYFTVNTYDANSWFGKEGFYEIIIPIVRCGGDGSFFAVWKDGQRYLFVFMGSEGECFTVTDSIRDFLFLITMGYNDILGEKDLFLTPQENNAIYSSGDWREPLEVKSFVRSIFDFDYPINGASILKKFDEDPFVRFVDEMIFSD